MKEQAYSAFSQSLHASARQNGFPLRVMFELTYRCNFRCAHCYVPCRYRGKKEIGTRDVCAILGQLKDLGCLYLGFTGGEPFLRDDIFPILQYARKCGFVIIIYTNGSLIDKKKARELAELRPNKVDITLPAMTRHAFERITGSPGSHRKVFAAVDALKKEGIHLDFKSCVLKENEGEIGIIREFASSLDAVHRLDDVLSPRLDGSRKPFAYRGRLRYVRGMKSAIVDTVGCAQDPGAGSRRVFECGVGVSQMAITPAGELKMCLMIDRPKYKTIQGLKKRKIDVTAAWGKLKTSVSSIAGREKAACTECGLLPYCKWCPAQGWLYNGDFSSCDPETRRKAQILKDLLG
jgi:radical SAM protein with 4Fe4S-binding SPASM domain